MPPKIPSDTDIVFALTRATAQELFAQGYAKALADNPPVKIPRFFVTRVFMSGLCLGLTIAWLGVPAPWMP